MKFTSEDLLKAMGLKVGQTVCVDNTMNFLIYEKGDIYFENLRSHSVISIDKFVEYILNFDYYIIQPKPTLTEVEKVILRNVDKRYKYIAKDNYEEKGMENDLVLFAQEPVKNDYWFEVSVENTDSVYFSGYLHLFQFIKPMECYSIEELLKE